MVECPAPGEGSLVTSLACSTSAVEGTRFCSAGMAESGRSPSSSSFPLPGTSCRFERWSTYLRFAPRPPPSLFTLYESGPVLLLMCAFFHLGPAVKFLTRTCPLCNCLSFLVLSCCTFCDNCWVSTRCLTSGRMRSSRVRRLQLNSNSAGVTPVVV